MHAGRRCRVASRQHAHSPPLSTRTRHRTRPDQLLMTTSCFVLRRLRHIDTLSYSLPSDAVGLGLGLGQVGLDTCDLHWALGSRPRTTQTRSATQVCRINWSTQNNSRCSSCLVCKIAKLLLNSLVSHLKSSAPRTLHVQHWQCCCSNGALALALGTVALALTSRVVAFTLTLVALLRSLLLPPLVNEKGWGSTGTAGYR